jgi:phage terminase Nu1 subunit (DNA packaging protein)
MASDIEVGEGYLVCRRVLVRVFLFLMPILTDSGMGVVKRYDLLMAVSWLAQCDNAISGCDGELQKSRVEKVACISRC